MKEYFLVFVQVENLVFHMVKDDVVMSCKVCIQVINEIVYYLMNNFQKQYEEIEFQLKININHFYSYLNIIQKDSR
jgi:hypothetical protein